MQNAWIHSLINSVQSADKAKSHNAGSTIVSFHTNTDITSACNQMQPDEKL